MPEHRKLAVIVLLSFVAIAIVAFYAYSSATPGQTSRLAGEMQLSSSAFGNNSPIPIRYTCAGDDISPPLSWSTPPTSSKALALIMEDPDAPSGTFTHWTLFNIPSNATALGENVPKQGVVAGLGLQGRNDFNTVGYGGPCPPAGSLHHYRITIYALDTVINLPAGSAKEEILAKTEGDILATGELVGTYGR